MEERVADVVYLSSDIVMSSEEYNASEKLEELNNLQSSINLYDDITIIDKDGVVITSTTYNYRGEWASKEWFKSARLGKVSISDAHVILEPYKTVMVFAAPIYDENNSVAAVIATQIDMKLFWKLMDEMDLGKSGFFYLVNGDNKLIAYPDKSRLFETSPADIKTCSIGSLRRTNELGVKVLEAYAPIADKRMYKDGSCWKVVASLNEDEALEVADTVKKQVIIYAGAILVISLIASRYLSRSVSSPIRSLAKTVDQISKGDLTAEVDPKLKASKDEVGQLARSFDRTTTSLKLAMKQLEGQSRQGRQQHDKEQGKNVN